jgi:ABC-type thiamine transport system ATPase subunit
MSDSSPKRAIDLVMERLRKQDAESGVTRTSLTDEQKQAIADARASYDARVAERQIMHRDKMFSTFDPAERQKLQDEYVRDMERYATERDATIRKVHEESDRT